MKRVLTVDDSKTARTLVKEALQSLDVEVLQAEDGRQGLQMVSKEVPDLVLLDVAMPIMDGPTMLKHLRGRGLKTPVILITASMSTSLVSQLASLGVDDYVTKPFNAGDLALKVRKILFPRASEQRVKTIDSAVRERKESLRKARVISFAEKRAHIDILFIDDSENGYLELKKLVPQMIKTDHAASLNSAIQFCRERYYRVVLVNIDVLKDDIVSSIRKLRAFQPSAAFVAVLPSEAEDSPQFAKEQGLDGAVFKPLDTACIEDLMAEYF
jgi:two-component system response regulator TctD